MDEMKPGERPDTIHFSNLPIKWFIPSQHTLKDGMKPSQRIFQRLFEKFGHIRCVDIPICDPYRSKMKEHMTGMKTFTFDQDTLFEGYVQFKDYVGFTKTMDAFRGMKLLHKDIDKAETISIAVDFDKTKHLSDSSIRRRQIVRERLITKDRDREEKEKQEKEKLTKEEQSRRQNEIEQKEAKERRQRDREERRKARHFAQLKLKETEELKKKIAKEERKLLKAQRKLEAIRLIGELFSRIKIKKEKDDAIKSDIDKNSHDEITKMKHLRERKVKEQRDKLHKALEGRVVLNSILGDGKTENSSTDSTSDSNSDKESKSKHKKKKSKKKKKKSKSHKEKPEAKNKAPEPTAPPANMDNQYPMGDPTWFGCIPPNGIYPYPQMYGPPMRGVPPAFYPYAGMRGRGGNGMPGPSRGQYPRRRGMFNPHWTRGWRGRRGSTTTVTIEIIEVILDHVLEVDLLHIAGHALEEDRTVVDRNLENTAVLDPEAVLDLEIVRDLAFEVTPDREVALGRIDHVLEQKVTLGVKPNHDVVDLTNPERKDKSRSPSYRSIDSSKFISPSRLRSKRSRSKSWSLPRSKDKKRSSWSKSPSPAKK
ncbi:Xe7 [Carabus blaptoides fortunei]